jgi:outer membrane immunogenic protein
MKKMLLATVAAFGFASVASAADLRMPVKAPPPVIAPAFSWTGCYIGGYVGGAWADNYSAYDRYDYLRATRDWSYDSSSSVIGGGTLGCNWQPVGSPFVLGLEGEVGYINLEGSAFNPLANTVFASAKVGDWYGMITGRLGYSFDRALIYVKGGAAFLNVEAGVWGPGFAASASDTITTWTVGGGLEYALDMNWSIKAEYMYIALDDTQATCGVFNTNYCFDNNLPAIQTAKIGINYRFGGARY